MDFTGTKSSANLSLQIITRDPSINTMNHYDTTVSNFMYNSIGLKRVKKGKSLYASLSFVYCVNI